MIKKFLIIGLVLLSISACGPQVNMGDIELVLADRIEAFRVAVEGGDVERIADFYSQDDRFWWVEDGRAAYPDYQTMKSSLEGLINAVEKTEMDIKSIGLNVIDEQMAVVFFDYEQKLTMKNGYTFEINGASTVHMIKEEDTWRFLYGHSSTLKER